MAKGGGSGGAPSGSKTGPAASSKPFVATPGREEARAVQRDLAVVPPPRAAERLMARQDRETALPGTAPTRAQGPARVMSTDWVEQDRQARLAQAVSSKAGQPMPAPGGTVTHAGPTPSEAQAIEAMRARLAKVWGVPSEPGAAFAGVETRDGRVRAWAAQLPGKAKGREEEREP